MAFETETAPEGPIWFGGNLTTETEDEDGRSYSIKWLPDKNNPNLRANGEPMHFYYMLDRSRLAEDTEGHYKFHLQKFAGVMDPNVNVGAEDYSEPNGGFLTFTTTMKIPEAAMEAAKEELKAKVEQQYAHHPLLRWNGDMPEPNFDNVPIVDNQTRLHTVSTAGRTDPATGSEGSSGPVDDEEVPPWGWHVQGEGDGSLNPTGHNAFSALLGQHPVSLIEAATESGESNLVIENELTYNVNTPVSEITVSGNWEAIFDHFSAAAEAKNAFLKADIEHEVEEMERDGTIEIEISYNEAFVDEEEVDKWEDAADEIAQTFLSIAEDKILTKETPDVERASADAPDAPLLPWWAPKADASFKNVEHTETLELDYSKEIDKRINRTSVQSSSLTGLFDEIQESEDAKDRYFSEVYLDEGWKKIHVISRANANWGGEDGDGDPLHHISCEVGYPESDGSMQFVNEARYRDSETADGLADSEPADWTADSADRVFVWDFLKHEDLENPNDITVRETVSYDESSDRVLVNSIEREYTTDSHTFEVRAETAGHFEVGPITLDMPINSEQVSVIVTLRAPEVPDERLEFTKGDAGPKRWELWYPPEGRPDSYQYAVQAIVNPPTFGLEELRWPEQPTWETVEGDGPLVVDVPAVPDDMRDKLQDYLSGG